jgi:8-oxo-dGTP pyrophosphatase MutT (NUDIX family)
MMTEPPGVIFVLVLPSRQVLLQQRDQADEKFPGSWCFPGGACEMGETHLQTVIREAKEEFNADLDISECQFLMSRKAGRNKVFVCTIPSAKGLKLQEGAAMQWYSIEEVQAMELGFQQADILPGLRKFLDEMW